ncbi:PilZ domain-containing protein [Ramlibacter terrae]|uniref:PilZ domain-containing protein n=1 Tax=Ramlibacter terrae TaxID=2732511 RepID=A0ABX6P2K5_9BURK|nr:PilZ domain-containing protein [Ramlibacter terrae]
MQNTTSNEADSGADHRAAVRFETDLPVRIDGAHGRTFNISAQGIYFETDIPQQLGALVNFTLEFNLYGQTHHMLCEAKVVRLEEQGARIGVGARLLAPFFAGEETAEIVAVAVPQPQAANAA